MHGEEENVAAMVANDEADFINRKNKIILSTVWIIVQEPIVKTGRKFWLLPEYIVIG